MVSTQLSVSPPSISKCFAILVENYAKQMSNFSGIVRFALFLTFANKIYCEQQKGLLLKLTNLLRNRIRV